MKAETIKNHIDNSILKMLCSNGYDETRNHFFNVASNFRNRIPSGDLNLESIEKISDSRNRYSAYYIYFVENRIVDLYKLEKDKIFNCSKSFKMLLFKERLERCESVPSSYNQKYKNYIK